LQTNKDDEVGDVCPLLYHSAARNCIPFSGFISISFHLLLFLIIFNLKLIFDRT
jgi:hypothetical protein